MGWMSSSTPGDAAPAAPAAPRASTTSQKVLRESSVLATGSFDLPDPSREAPGIQSLAKPASGKNKKNYWELIKIPGSSCLELLPVSLSHLLVPHGFSWEPAQSLSPQLIPVPRQDPSQQNQLENSQIIPRALRIGSCRE